MEAIMIVLQEEPIALEVLIKLSMTCRTMRKLLTPMITEKTTAFQLFEELRENKESWWVDYRHGNDVKKLNLYHYVNTWRCTLHLFALRYKWVPRWTIKHLARFQWIVCAIFEKIIYVRDSIFKCRKRSQSQTSSRLEIAACIFDEWASICLQRQEHEPKQRLFLLDLLHDDDKFLRFKEVVDSLPSLFLTSKPNFQRLLS